MVMQTGDQARTKHDNDVVELINSDGVNRSGHPIILVCEHASNFIPEEFYDLGLDADACKSHIAWDIGAFKLAENMSKILNAPLISSKVSRLIYDCNRPPEETSAIPEKSEVFEIEGNKNLSIAEREDRAERFYRPFHDLMVSIISSAMDKDKNPIIVTIHTFAPQYFGKSRSVEIGIICDEDTRFADSLLDVVSNQCEYNVQRNQPYGADDGVTHTLKEHAVSHDLLHVMIEVRNDLVEHDPLLMAEFLSKNILIATKAHL